MGAAPVWKGLRPVVSPLREVESHTVSVASPTGKPGPQRFARVPTHASGVYFLAPRDFQPGTAIELEVALIERPLGQGSVQMCTAAHIVRAEEVDMPGWRGYAATFDDFALRRDDIVPLRYRSH